MRYVTRVLQPGETVLHEAHLHWFIFLRAIAFMVLAIAFFIGEMVAGNTEPIIATTLIVIACFFALIAVEMALKAWIRRVTTEFAITDRRVIYKTGLFSRHTLEMNRGKVERVDVDQPLDGPFVRFRDGCLARHRLDVSADLPHRRPDHIPQPYHRRVIRPGTWAFASPRRRPGPISVIGLSDGRVTSKEAEAG